MKDVKYQYFIAICVLFIGGIYFTVSKDQTTGESKPSEFNSISKYPDRKLAQSKPDGAIESNEKNRKKLNDIILKSPALVARSRRVSNSRTIKTSNLVSIGEFKFLKNLRAIPNTPSNREMFPDAEVKLGHLLVSSEFAQDSLSTVYNDEYKTKGIFTKVIKIKLKSDSLSLLEEELRDFSYEIRSSHPHLNIYNLKFDNDLSTIEAYDFLKNKAFIKRSSIEVLYFERTSK